MNEDEFADFLETGDTGPGPHDPSDDRTRRAAAGLREMLGDDSMWAEPDPAGADALLAAIGAESQPRLRAAAPPEAPAAPARPPARPTDAVAPLHRAQRARRARADRRLLVLAVAAVAVVVLGVVGALVRTGGDGGGEQFAIAGTNVEPGASASATVEERPSGVAITLDVHALPAARRGTYYQGWVKGDNGLVTIGTFHMRGGDDTVDLWAGVDLDDYPMLTVTIQREGGGQDSSGIVVLSGRIVR